MAYIVYTSYAISVNTTCTLHTSNIELVQQRSVAPHKLWREDIIIYTVQVHRVDVHVYTLNMFRVQSVVGYNSTRGSSFLFGKVTALGVLCCFALFFVWPCLLLPSFCISH